MLRRKISLSQPRSYGKQSEPSLAFKTDVGDRRWKAVMGEMTSEIVCEAQSVKAFTLEKGQLCRIRLIEGSQVATVNFWNADNKKEHFSQGLTRIYNSTHLKVFDQLWSAFPHVRPMATFAFDTNKSYGIDADRAGLHDVLRPISEKRVFDEITKVVKDYGLTLNDVHDGWNAFCCSGLSDTHEYFEKSNTTKKGDYVEFIAEMNLIVAVSTFVCATFETSDGERVGEEYFPVQIEIFQESEEKDEEINGDDE
ncbi:uncharacterized protein LOC134838299 [Culicoides brevitarsis]|uniref:uncharacterized protein LOC134838299 n=1 Tax=Culicoides brevitarsis TaxID=469753 RepID=UPI00307B66BA